MWNGNLERARGSSSGNSEVEKRQRSFIGLLIFLFSLFPLPLAHPHLFTKEVSSLAPQWPCGY